MSSHHIVREKQEPALLIMDLGDFTSENLGQLLEWSPTVIVDANIYEEAESLGIEIDYVISPDPDFSTQENTRIILTDENALSDGLKYLVGEQYPAVNIITKGFSLKDYVLFTGEINLVIFSGGKKIYPVRSGFSKWQAAGEQIELMHPASNLTVSGLYYLTDTVLETEKDGFYSLRFDQPFIFISEIV